MPITYSQVSDDTIDQELASLQHGFTPPGVKKYGLRLTDYKSPSGQSAYDRWSQLQGEVKINKRTLREDLRKLINSKSYQKMPQQDYLGEDSGRVRAVRSVIRRYRDKAFLQTLREYPELQQDLAVNQRKIQRGLTGQEPLDGGFVQNVFSRNPRKLFPN